MPNVRFSKRQKRQVRSVIYTHDDDLADRRRAALRWTLERLNRGAVDNREWSRICERLHNLLDNRDDHR